MKMTTLIWRQKTDGLMRPFLMALAFPACFVPALFSQNTCTYTIQMADAFSDGWNGGFLTVTSAGETTTHALTFGATGTSTFKVKTGVPVHITYTTGNYPNEPTFQLRGPNNTLLLNGTSPLRAGVLYNQPGLCPACVATPNPNIVVINQVTDTSAFVNWSNVTNSKGYVLEYGPIGFYQSTGTVLDLSASEANLSGLNPCVTYDVYIHNVCGADSLSSPIGPYQFTTKYDFGPSGAPCTYKLQMFSASGFGWDQAFLRVSYPGFTQQYDFFNGFDQTYDVPIPANVLVTISYIPAYFTDQNNSYKIVDPNGVVLFSDGPPARQYGEVLKFVACPDCPAPLSVAIKDVNATNAELRWSNYPGTTGQYIIEYGPTGFQWGAGTADTIPANKTTHRMTGLLEKTRYDVYMRTLCSGGKLSKPTGPLQFRTLWLNDVGVSGITAPDPATKCNFDAEDTITVLLRNYGQLPQTLFEFHYAVNGVPASIPLPQDGFFTGVVGNDSTQSISFETTWDFSVPGFYFIEAWTVLEGDSDPSNDTFRLKLLTTTLKPLQEDFEDGLIPEGWSTNAFTAFPGDHNNPTFVLSSLLYDYQKSATTTTQRVGPIEEGDSLTFDYRFVDAFAGIAATQLGADDKLEVQISTDCGETFETVHTIDKGNHVASSNFAKKVIDLSDFAGEAIDIRFQATWGTGFYWFDLDNVNVFGCPATLGLLANVAASVNGQPTGSIDVNPEFGQAPYKYDWNTGDTAEVVKGLLQGTYQVTVTDANGCSDTRVFNIGLVVATGEAEPLVESITLFPNPTTGSAFVDISLSENTDYQVRLFNMSGQLLFESAKTRGSYGRQALDLSNQPAGMYIVQILVNGSPHYGKLILAR
jgi:hypothetical protein